MVLAEELVDIDTIPTHVHLVVERRVNGRWEPAPAISAHDVVKLVASALKQALKGLA